MSGDWGRCLHAIISLCSRQEPREERSVLTIALGQFLRGNWVVLWRVQLDRHLGSESLGLISHYGGCGSLRSRRSLSGRGIQNVGQAGSEDNRLQWTAYELLTLIAPDPIRLMGFIGSHDICLIILSAKLL